MNIKVLRGNPTPEELAAALAVVRARAAAEAAAPVPAPPTHAWTDRTRNAPRRPLPSPGPAAWHRTYWPS
ncbi:acyl-CoA carboxylase epsilon subunit [Streptomyces chartreusis]|uniref:acyl-CoA carboxylase epsilon subunit n=1 Tax=Streptomyces chartreusis TaxID=1969 RepID=UPI00369804CA